MTTYDPSTAPRNREAGYKGDGWIVSLEPEADEPKMLLDTGLDSVAIMSIPDRAWDHAPTPRSVHAHEGYDETILVTRGSGFVLHGPDPREIVATRFERPVVLVVPAGAWHHVQFDPAARAHGFCFFTRTGTVIAPFTTQMQAVTTARVTYRDLPIVRPARVTGSPVTGTAVDASVAARLVDAPSEGARPDIRILPFEPPPEGELSLPLDTGIDSLFVMAAPPPVAADDPRPLELLDPPDVVDVHSHPDVDEYIILAGGRGELLNGPTPDAITRTPFQGPCVVVMPAGGLHRIVMAEEHARHMGPVLVYADRRAVVERFEAIVARTTGTRFAEGLDQA
ncbi:MAG: hypothetical protein ABWZ82_06285 [Candidatus Limnocylindrales bacterium]